MKIGVSTASFYPLETEQALEKIGEFGIDTTEIFFNARSELKPSFIDILSNIKNRYKINVSSLHPTLSLAESFMIFSSYERRFWESMDDFARYSEIAAELGAKYIIMHGGKPNGILSDEEYCEKYMRLKEQTLKNGVTILQENVYLFRSADIQFLRSMKSILGKDAEFCLDIKQSVRCGYDPIQLLTEFHSNIKHLHISDHNISSDCMLPMNGGFDFKNFFKILNSFEYKGSCIIEVYRDAYKNYEEITKSCLKLADF